VRGNPQFSAASGDLVMPTKDPNSWAYHDDFAETIVSKNHQVALRLLETADIALTFARALVAKEYQKASAMLTPELKRANPPETLRKKLEEMIGYSGDEKAWPTYVLVVQGIDASDMDKSPRKKKEDFGWTYVAIGGADYNEAVSVTVTEEGEQLRIREIEWGRP
jgi:hypothetical protein